jgi:hypothetical protein
MSHRFFTTSQGIYDAARQALDVIFGHPNGKADTCLPPEPLTLPDGRVVIGVLEAMTQWQEVTPLIDGLLESGAAVEITAQEYSQIAESGDAVI